MRWMRHGWQNKSGTSPWLAWLKRTAAAYGTGWAAGFHMLGEVALGTSARILTTGTYRDRRVAARPFECGGAAAMYVHTCREGGTLANECATGI